VIVNLLLLRHAVQLLELALDVLRGLLVGVSALVLGKADGQRRGLDLLLEKILLVKEEDN